MKNQIFFALALMLSANQAFAMACDPASKNCVKRNPDAAFHASEVKARTNCVNLPNGRLTDVDDKFRPNGSKVKESTTVKTGNAEQI